MNFLAHLYLSGKNDQVIVGNFIGDWIKGNEFKKYPLDVQKGILVHRSIDSYTDNHSVVRQSKSRLNHKYHKYSGIIIDIFYDHFLASNWENYSKQNIDDFMSMVSKSIEQNLDVLSVEMQDFFPRFMRHRWIESYHTVEGIEKVLEGMSRNTSLPDETKFAIDILKEHYTSFSDEFFTFFPQLMNNIEEIYHLQLFEQMP